MILEESQLYFEAHVTIEPVEGERLEKFSEICAKHHFRVAKLLMQKPRLETEERSNKDAFCTSRSKQYARIATDTIELVQELIDEGYVVWRYKIEDTVLDSQIDDVFSLLGKVSN